MLVEEARRDVGHVHEHADREGDVQGSLRVLRGDVAHRVVGPREVHHAHT